MGPLKMRLIAIIPQLYRLRASTRAHEINTEWLPHVVNRFTFGGVKGRAARTASSIDSLLWDAARTRGVGLKAVYLDCSRCFATLKYSDLLGVAARLGLGRRVCTGLRNFYEHHERFVLVRNWVQPALCPRRGIPQGCPLSVLMAILWGLTWSSRVEQMFSAGPRQIAGCTTYLDDYSLIMEDEATLQGCLGWTTQHFRLWQVALNMEKSSLLSTPNLRPDTIQGETTELSSDSLSYKLLGISTGWFSSSECLKERADKAAQTANRIHVLRLSQALFRRLSTIFVIPLLYGSEFEVKQESCEALDKKLWHGLWGRARVSACRAAVMALCLPSHKCTAAGRRWMDAARAIWALANDEHRRPLLMEIWASPQLPRKGGLWATFLNQLSLFKLKLAPDGGVAVQEDSKLIMHIAQARSAWLHQARLVWRRYHIARAADAHNALYITNAAHMDWAVTLQPSLRSPALDTVQGNAVNSKSRAARHFTAQCSPTCEHGCDEHDVFAHRLLRCPAGQGLRNEHHLNQEALDILSNEQICMAETLQWQHPPCTRQWVPDIHSAWGLWPCKEWLDDVIRHLQANEGAAVMVNFEYVYCKWGDHEQLQRHAASVHLSTHMLVRKLTAFGLSTTSQRQHWEAEALLLAAIIAQLTKAPVHLLGCEQKAENLWSLIKHNEIANAHLHQFALLAKNAVQIVERLPDDLTVQEYTSHELAKDVHFAIPNDAILAWQKTFQVAQKAALFCRDSPPLYPLAAAISYSHGACARGGSSSGWKGGPCGASCGTFVGGEPLLLLTLESFCSLDGSKHKSSKPPNEFLLMKAVHKCTSWCRNGWCVDCFRT